MKRLPPVAPRERFTVTIKRTTNSNYFTISGPGGIQRRERRFIPRWVLLALADVKAIEAQASVDRAGRWCIDPR
jgi:hypothetical protein